MIPSRKVTDFAREKGKMEPFRRTPRAERGCADEGPWPGCCQQGVTFMIKRTFSVIHRESKNDCGSCGAPTDGAGATQRQLAKEFVVQKTLLSRRRFCGAAATVATGTLGPPFFFRREYSHE